MKTFKHIGRPTSTFRLNERYLRETQTGWRGWRQVKRAQLAKLFRSKPVDGVRTVYLDAQFDGRVIYYDHWRTIYGNARLSIGCVHFSVVETEAIREWALASK